MKLSDKIEVIKGIGPSKVKLFESVGVRTVDDLLNYLPRTYDDRSAVKTISEIVEGEEVSVTAQLAGGIVTNRIRGGTRSVFMSRGKIYDETGVLDVVWFNNPYAGNMYKIGEEYAFFGKVKRNKSGKLQFQNPVAERISGDSKFTGRIVPIYPLTAKLTQRAVQDAVFKCLEGLREPIPEILPSELLERYSLLDSEAAIRNMHVPDDFELFERARRRLVFEELLLLQLGLHRLRGEREVEKCEPFEPAVVGESVREFSESLPYKLTFAQSRVIDEICGNLCCDSPMTRLVQGDVGSGKTVVAASAMYAAVRSGFQACMMVPTDILAEQHYANLSKMFEPFGIEVVYLSGKMRVAERRAAQEKLRSNPAVIAVGTHALISDDVEFAKLGLVITDEQHRFGVKQRTSLAEKAASVNMLVMSATPIPRTLALVIYGDMDVSVIDELPPGRTPIETYSVDESKRERIYNFIKKNADEGRQAYIVCPLIEESVGDGSAVPQQPPSADAAPPFTEGGLKTDHPAPVGAPLPRGELKSAVEYAELLKHTILADFRIAAMHSKLKAAEKTEIMRAFVAGEIDILVSTTVIEVGVDVPNANLMVIENAERFGLSQLHQLRGRVGRGTAKSYCVMFCAPNAEIAQERMKVMCDTNDGFVIAQEDLRLRGPGDFFGTKQHGVPEMRIANLFSDMDILKDAQVAVAEILEEDSALELVKHGGIRGKIQRMFERMEVS